MEEAPCGQWAASVFASPPVSRLFAELRWRTPAPLKLNFGESRAMAMKLALALTLGGFTLGECLRHSTRLNAATYGSAALGNRDSPADGSGGPTHAGRVSKTVDHPSLWNGMKHRHVGGDDSDLVLSEVGLGTMMWGSQTSEEEAAAILQSAFDYGVNWVDTAELYPTPASAESQGETERMLGRLLQGRERSSYNIATKVVGRSTMDWMRPDGAPTRLSADQIKAAVDGSLQRLGTDHIDLLQLHWPDRYVPLFGEPEYDIGKEMDDVISFEEQLLAIDDLIEDGKVRHWGLSNETPYGLTSFCAAAVAEGLARPKTVQNCYNMLNRADFENGMLEACAPRHLDVGLLGYSPLAGGALSGKYLLREDEKMSNSRLDAYPGFFKRYDNDLSREALAEYRIIASDFGVTLAQMALAFAYTRPFVSSTIIGATSVAQVRYGFGRSGGEEVARAGAARLPGR